MKTEILFDWPIATVSGWGVLGKNLVREAALGGTHEFVPIGSLPPEHLLHLSPDERSAMGPAIAAGQALRERIVNSPSQGVSVPRIFLKYVGPDLRPAADLMGGKHVLGKPTIGIGFFETEGFPKTDVDAFNDQFRGLVLGSTWNFESARNAGIRNCRLALQGIDPRLFYPCERTNRGRSRFVIFSGGKLERRKGQDLVVEAFRAFVQRHPDAFLLATWGNIWAGSELDVNRNQRLKPLRLGDDGRADVVSWLVENGIPRENFRFVDIVHNSAVLDVLKEADVGLFPNRCEGGTNLVAMEAMASGLPVILSSNSGHLDLVDESRCLSLSRQSQGVGIDPAGWRESDVDEIVAALERAYHDHALRQKLGAAGARFMATWSWKNQVARFQAVIDELVALV